MKEKQLIVITGPTAVGKTSFTISFAQKNNLEIVSCDSRQFYKEMNIGTAKPSAEELKSAPHHFINSLSIQDEYSAGHFERDGLALLDRLFRNHDRVILSGGSGLYIKALCEGLNHFPEIPSEIRKELNVWSLSQLQTYLADHDPLYFSQVDIQNHHRLIRAVSVIKTTGKPFSYFTNETTEARDFDIRYIVLNRDREELYERINQRVDDMMKAGLEEEVRALYPFRNYNSLQTVGYQEFFPYFEGEYDLEHAVFLIKRNSRRYAKRQLTWFRKLEHALWLHPEDAPGFIAEW